MDTGLQFFCTFHSMLYLSNSFSFIGIINVIFLDNVEPSYELYVNSSFMNFLHNVRHF